MLFLLALINITGGYFLSGTNIKIDKSVDAEVQITVDNTAEHPIEIAKPITTAKSNYKLINPIPEGLNILSPKEIPKVANKGPVPHTSVKATNTPQTQIANPKEMVRSNNRTIPSIKSSQPAIKNKRNTPTTNIEVSSLGTWEDDERQKPWKKLARPYKNQKKNPRIGVVIYGLGTSAAATRSAIQGLPGAVTLAFSPYTSRLGDWIDIARAASHEVLIMITPARINKQVLKQTEPQEPVNFESNSTLNVLSSVLSRERNYIGVTNYFPPGSKFEAADLQKLFQILKEKGLLFLESRPTEGKLSREISNKFKLPFAANKIFIDNLASRTAIRKKLEEAEQIAQSQGEVIVMGFFYPVTLELLVAWTKNLDSRGFSLAPISALAKL
ncbi:MAG: divergent polysaccharide deacetylase family protein [Rhodospirillaceae bacterium]